MGLWDKVKKKINQLLKNIAKENQKSFGSERLDCCDLNRNTGGKDK